jgi:Flp pilus assembly CpaE family ATPase
MRLRRSRRLPLVKCKMTKTAINVLLIEDSPDYAELVQVWLAAACDQVTFVLNWTDSLSAGLDRLCQGGVDAVLLDLGLPDSEGVDTYIAVRAVAPGIPIIGLSASDSESLALRMIQEGAEDYLVKSTCNRELLAKAVSYAVVRRSSQANKARPESPHRGRVIGILGVKGGVGTTTVACYLAGELRRQTSQEVLLADLDVQAGMASFLMGVEPKYSILDAITNIDRLDRSCWDSIVSHCAAGLNIIASPCLLGGGDLDANGLRRIMVLAPSFYPWVVADLGRQSTLSTSLLDRIDDLFLVTTPSISGLYQAKRAVDHFAGSGMDADRMHLIVNQTDDRQSLSGGDLNTIFGIPVYARLPQDNKPLQDACVQKRLPELNSAIGKHLVKLARRIAGLSETQCKRGLPEFFSLLVKSRKSADTMPTRQDGLLLEPDKWTGTR